MGAAFLFIVIKKSYTSQIKLNEQSGPRQTEIKSRAFARLAFQPDAPMMMLDDLSGQIQTDTEPGNIFGALVFDAVKPVKDLSRVCR